MARRAKSQAKEQRKRLPLYITHYSYCVLVDLDTMPSEKRTCPCKRIPLSLSSFTAAEYGDLHSLERSMKNSRLSSVDRVDSGGYTPLHLAAQNGHVAATSLLLQLGANPDHNSSGATPLHRTSYSGAISTMSLLLEEKWHCDLLARDTSFGDGMTPLHKAAAGGRYLAVKLLLHALRERQSNDGGSMLQQGLEALDSLQRTPLDLATELFQNQEEEQQSVRRWDAVAGGIADWQECIQLLTEAENEIQKGLPTRSISRSLPALPKHLTGGASCLDCDTSGDGSCLTASWEAAFRSALSSSMMDTPASSVPTTDLKIEDVSQVEPTGENLPAKYATNTEENMDCEPDVGQRCETCGVRSFALYPSTNGKLVCRTCFKPNRKIPR